MLQKQRVIALFTYSLSLYANDYSVRFFHKKTYISLVAELLLPVLLVFSGSAFRAMRTSAGKLWLVYFVLLLIDLPFSVWRTGSASLLLDYGIKSWPLLFYIVSFAVTLKSLRQYMY